VCFHPPNPKGEILDVLALFSTTPVFTVIQPPTLYEILYCQGGVNNSAGEISDLEIVTNEKNKVASILGILSRNPSQPAYLLASCSECGILSPYKGLISRPLMLEAPLSIIREIDQTMSVLFPGQKCVLHSPLYLSRSAAHFPKLSTPIPQISQCKAPLEFFGCLPECENLFDPNDLCVVECG